MRLRLLHPVTERTHLAQLQAAVALDAESRVAQIEPPTLVVTGDDGVVVPPENSRNLAALVLRARLSVIEGAGHMAFIERAGEFNLAVVEFLAEPPAIRF